MLAITHEHLGRVRTLGQLQIQSADIVSRIVRRNISSALILEDDADWDVRIKHQLHDFAMSTRTLTQPLLHDGISYADPTFPSPLDPSLVPDDIDFYKIPPTVPPKTSPYGDNWDFLWLGHSTMRFPNPGLASAAILPKGRVVTMDEPTVPGKEGLPKEGLPSIPPELGNDLRYTYPDHTRVVHHVADGLASTAYATTQSGARELLLWVGLTRVNQPYDVLLRYFCDGADGRQNHTCLAPNPSLFQPYRAPGWESADTDIQLSYAGTGFREKGFTEGVRWSTRVNFGVLLAGERDFEDSYPDEPTPEII